MAAISSQSQSKVPETTVLIQQPTPPLPLVIEKVFSKFNFHGKSGLLLFWECTPASSSEDIVCNLKLTNTFPLTPGEGLEDYRRICLAMGDCFVGKTKNVGNWLVGRAAQTGIADQRTIHYVPNQDSADDLGSKGKGQLVSPVFDNQDVPLGIIDFVTPIPKENYAEDFEQIHKLLQDEGLKSTYMGKTIKVKYGDGNDWIRFKLPLSAKFTDLQSEVGKRFPELEHHQTFCTEDNRLPISNDADLQLCMSEPSTKGAQFIKMLFC